MRMQRQKFKSYLLSAICIVYIALITFQPSLNFMPEIGWLIDRQRLLELLLLCLVLIHSVLFQNLAINIVKMNKTLTFVLLVLLILTLFSILLAFSPRHALTEFGIFAALGF